MSWLQNECRWFSYGFVCIMKITLNFPNAKIDKHTHTNTEMLVAACFLFIYWKKIENETWDEFAIN